MTTWWYELEPIGELEVVGHFSKGYPERGPTYDCAGEPGEPPSIEFDHIWAVKGEARVDLLDVLSDKFLEKMEQDLIENEMEEFHE